MDNCLLRLHLFPIRLSHIFILHLPYLTIWSLKAVKKWFTKYLIGSDDFAFTVIFSKSCKVIMHYHSHWRDGGLGFRGLDNLAQGHRSNKQDKRNQLTLDLTLTCVLSIPSTKTHQGNMFYFSCNYSLTGLLVKQGALRCIVLRAAMWF